MTWMDRFFGLDAAGQVRRGVWISAALLAAWGVLQFFLVPLQVDAGIDANVSFKSAPAPGSEVKGPVEVVATGSALSGLKTMTVSILPDGSGVPSVPTDAGAAATYPLGTGTADLALAWDPRKMTPYNGSYKLIATADSNIGEKVAAATGSILVNVAPSPPAGVSVRLDSGVPVLTWSPNTEPDMLGYRVARISGGNRADLTMTTAPGFQDDKAPAGVPITYEVAAVRRSPLSAEGIASLPARSASALVVPLVEQVETVVSTPSTVPDLKPAEAPAKVAAKTEKVLAADRNVGFEEYLPYEQPIPMKVEAPMELTLQTPQEVSFSENSSGSAPVDIEKYLAASMVLLVAALHTARMARRLIVSF